MLNTNLASRQIHSHTKIYTEYVRHLESELCLLVAALYKGVRKVTIQSYIY